MKGFWEHDLVNVSVFFWFLLFWVQSPQSSCNRNIQALLNVLLINLALREIWRLVDCWTYTSGAMLDFPCYKQQRKSQHLLRIWLRPLNLPIPVTDQRSLQSSNTTSLSKQNFLHPRVVLNFTDSNEWIKIWIIPHGQKRNCLQFVTGKTEKYIG